MEVMNDIFDTRELIQETGLISEQLDDGDLQNFLHIDDEDSLEYIKEMLEDVDEVLNFFNT